MPTRLVVVLLCGLLCLAAAQVALAWSAPTHSNLPQLRGLEPAADAVVYVTRTGACYHRWGCQYLDRSWYRLYRSQAVARGYRACSRCRP